MTQSQGDSSSPATALAVHVKFIIPICNQNGAPDEYQLVGAMPGHGSGAHSNERSHKAMQTHSSHFHRHGLRTASTGLGLFLTVLGIAVFCRLASPAAAEFATPINPPLAGVPNSTGSGTDRAVVAGGCFWGVQAVFQHTKGVTSGVSGYAGGTLSSPSYEQSAPAARGMPNRSKSHSIRSRSLSAACCRYRCAHRGGEGVAPKYITKEFLVPETEASAHAN